MKRSWVMWLSALAIAIVGIAGLSRNSILEWAFKHEQAHFKDVYHLNLSASSIRFSSWNCIELLNVCLQPEGADTLAAVKHIQFKPSLVGLFTGSMNLKEITIDSAVVTIFNENDRNNLSAIRNKRPQQINGTQAQSNYYRLADNLRDRFLKVLSTSFKISNLQISYRDTAITEDINIPGLEYDQHNLTGLLVNRQLNDTLGINAEVLDRNKAFRLTLQHYGAVLNYLPFFDYRNGFKCRFQRVSAEVRLDDADDELQIFPSISVTNFHIQHWRLAKEDVVFPMAQFTGLLKIKQDGFELDSSSTVTLNHATCRVYAGYFEKPDTLFALNINMPEMPSDTFFNALPGGMFNTLKGISCSGTLAYNLQFAIHTRQPDSLIFESQLKRKNLHIIHMGNENYARINDPFVYDAYNGDQFVRHIVIGPENPEFTPYNRISPYLPAAIMQSEDPSFMVHRGFVPEAFRESIAKNFKEKRFARGGSTISMQLVKNVFLNRNKTISRKAEEALIVYLIENLGLVPKERMMEVYLNIIEWAPDIYGVGEAARFYFNKKPADLNLPESIFLAAIIPNPKYFKYQFDKQGKVKPYMADFFKLIVNRMVLRGYLSEKDTIHFVPGVQLSGPAANLVMPADSAVPGMEQSLPGTDDQ